MLCRILHLTRQLHQPQPVLFCLILRSRPLILQLLQLLSVHVVLFHSEVAQLTQHTQLVLQLLDLFQKTHRLFGFRKIFFRFCKLLLGFKQRGFELTNSVGLLGRSEKPGGSRCSSPSTWPRRGSDCGVGYAAVSDMVLRSRCGVLPGGGVRVRKLLPRQDGLGSPCFSSFLIFLSRLSTRFLKMAKMARMRSSSESSVECSLTSSASAMALNLGLG
ncbi:hypothetical protein GGX14DRAFT_469868 [Mycena pura]|uniref:Uncharacterized protein n=1 Tax=Mycena pura TaxID=153505 RepID=A0AAD6Y4B3_9AGAR|nr:hypothetical protein GGX14DRAFT_469868 [Mycena pura]